MAWEVNGWSEREKRPRLFHSRPIGAEAVGVLTERILLCIPVTSLCEEREEGTA